MVGFAGRALIISGVLACVTVLAIPVAAAFPGSVIGEAVSVVWLLSLVPVAIGVHRLVAQRAGAISLVAMIVGVAGMTVQVALLLAIVAGLAAPLENAPTAAAAYVVTGLWLVAASRLMISFGILPGAVGSVGVATGLVQLASYVLLQLGGFPTSTDPSTLSSLSAATIVASMLSLLSIPLYAVWGIWAGRRLSRTYASAAHDETMPTRGLGADDRA